MKLYHIDYTKNDIIDISQAVKNKKNTTKQVRADFEYNMVTHSRDFSHELVTYQLFNY